MNSTCVERGLKADYELVRSTAKPLSHINRKFDKSFSFSHILANSFRFSFPCFLVPLVFFF